MANYIWLYNALAYIRKVQMDIQVQKDKVRKDMKPKYYQIMLLCIL